MNAASPLSESEMIQWEEAYAAVESYLQALRIRNRLVIADKVQAILARARLRAIAESTASPRFLAMEETLGEIASWTQSVLSEELESGRLAARGRLALLLADMPGRWQGVFLMPPPWPSAFVDSMRTSYLTAGPGFAEMKMVARPLDLNALGTGAALWYEAMDRSPIVRKIFFAAVVVGLLSALWFFLF